MENEGFNPVPEQDSLSEADLLVLLSALEMIYDILRFPEDSKKVFTESLSEMLQIIGSSQVSDSFRTKSIEHLTGILKSPKIDQKDMNAAKVYIENLIKYL